MGQFEVQKGRHVEEDLATDRTSQVARSSFLASRTWRSSWCACCWRETEAAAGLVEGARALEFEFD